ncbi:hypothetical protein PCANC_09374 [Puccinia coronata f. sp. avenae]|uniref:Uncharacterized protein n=1 Tax=Puccinia coronata f. sp. avenae TaxID=200324 RepID=A0A2N5VDB8_9BASI|nr:hypothetical protein PCANC_09374 [Puccinia coronata f. sp. avenae]
MEMLRQAGGSLRSAACMVGSLAARQRKKLELPPPTASHQQEPTDDSIPAGNEICREISLFRGPPTIPGISHPPGRHPGSRLTATTHRGGTHSVRARAYDPYRTSLRPAAQARIWASPRTRRKGPDRGPLRRPMSTELRPTQSEWMSRKASLTLHQYSVHRCS